MEELIRKNEQQSNILLRRVLIGFIVVWGILLAEIYITEVDAYYLTFYTQFSLIGAAFAGIGLMTDHLLQERYSHWKKYVLIASLLLVLIVSNIMACRMILVTFFVPMMLSCRYYDSKFQRQVSYLTLITIILAWLLGGMIGFSLDLNQVRYTSGMVITLTDSPWLEDALVGEPYDRIAVTWSYIVYAIPTNVLFWLLAHIGSLGITKSSRTIMKQSAISSAKEAAYAQELSIGSDIQHSMLPKDFQSFPGHEKLDIFGYYQSAKEVGGDFYTFFAIDDHRQCILIGDVSGKGVPAALFMARCLTCLKNFAMMGLDTAEIMSRANRFMCEGNDDDLFVTVWLGILDTEKEELQFTSGGHNPSVICRKGESFAFTKRKSNFILGMEPSVKYHSDTISFHQGDKIFLYTDGVSECMNEEENCYGDDRLIAFLNEHQTYNCRTVVQALAENLKKYAGSAPQSDDITMLMLEML